MEIAYSGAMKPDYLNRLGKLSIANPNPFQPPRSQTPLVRFPARRHHGYTPLTDIGQPRHWTYDYIHICVYVCVSNPDCQTCVRQASSRMQSRASVATWLANIYSLLATSAWTFRTICQTISDVRAVWHLEHHHVSSSKQDDMAALNEFQPTDMLKHRYQDPEVLIKFLKKLPENFTDDQIKIKVCSLWHFDTYQYS